MHLSQLINNQRTNMQEQSSIPRNLSVSYALLPDDIWGEVFSFFCEDFSIANLLLLSKHMNNVIHNCTNLSIQIYRYQIDEWNSVYSWLEKFKRLDYIDISSSNCKPTAIRKIMQNRDNISSKPKVSISKCFALNEDIIQDFNGFEHVALCDIDLKQQVPLSFFTNLKTLIFSNNVFCLGSLQHMFENFPPSLTVLALGGSKMIAKSSSYQPASIDRVCRRDNLCIEVTFIDEADRLFLQTMFPNATLMDLTNDPIETLEATYERMHWDEARFSRALVSCNDGMNSTPLHIACREGDMRRCQWLLSLKARVDLKDYKGCISLHRAVESCQIVERERHLCTSEQHSECDAKMEITPSALCADALPEPLWPPTDSMRFSAWQCVASCLDYGAGCFVRNQNYETPLYVAALKGNGVALFTMISHMRRTISSSSLDPTMTSHASSDYLSIDEKSSDLREFSPLHAAILCKSLYCIRLLLLAGCSPNKQNKYGSTALHLAYRSDVKEIISMITDAGGCLDIKDFSGDLPVRYSPEARKKHSSSRKKTTHHRWEKRTGGKNAT
jgi:ankyrin repeat protein